MSNQIKDRPILFSGPMIRAILDGRKTQTRRIGKWQNDDATELGVEYSGHATKGSVAVATYRAFPDGGTARWGLCECPYGIPGDRLWVRETFARIGAKPRDRKTIYRAEFDWENNPQIKWKPSIFMPRWASRITLEIIGVRVERLQNISDEDVLKEGVSMGPPMDADIPEAWESLFSWRFKKLWESINGKGSWANNPWVWIIEFRKL